MEIAAKEMQIDKEKDASIAVSLGVILIAVGYFVFSVLRVVNPVDVTAVTVLNTIFISILMQAFPFMLIGVFVSSAMNVFISDEFLVKIFPTRKGIGFLTALFGGILFPVCECAIVPVTTRLVKKGVSLPIALTFMFSAPIINPIVIISTLYAFPGQPKIALVRVVFGLIIALLIGLVILFLGIDDKKSMLCDELNHSHNHIHIHGCGCKGCNADEKEDARISLKIKNLFLHAGDEFFSVGKYLVLGAFLTSLIQTIIPRSIFVGLWNQNSVSLLIMMVTAFLFSACSTSDAFIARSFMDRFTTGSIMGFLIFGPMMDIKNLLMLLGSFKKSFVLLLFTIVFSINFIILYVFVSLIL